MLQDGFGQNQPKPELAEPAEPAEPESPRTGTVKKVQNFESNRTYRNRCHPEVFGPVTKNRTWLAMAAHMVRLYLKSGMTGVPDPSIMPKFGMIWLAWPASFLDQFCQDLTRAQPRA